MSSKRKDKPFRVIDGGATDARGASAAASSGVLGNGEPDNLEDQIQRMTVYFGAFMETIRRFPTILQENHGSPK